MKRLLIIFVKNPVEGKVKSRLAASIGTGKALAVYLKLMARTRDVVLSVKVDRQVCYSTEIEKYDLWSNDDFDKDLQIGDDLGLKMYHAIEKASKANYDKICLIGSDNMEITSAIINDAFSILASKESVFGPSKDGGYYLVGLRKPYKELFTDIEWSTAEVLDQTIDKVRALNLTYGLLPELNDIDLLEDIREGDRPYLLN